MRAQLLSWCIALARLGRSVAIVGLVFLISTSALAVEYPLFDRGPDPDDPMQRELVEIIQDMPYLPGISEQLKVLVPSYKRGQKMRPDFGAMPMRGFAIPNSISVLVIGQDGTHIAEGANRPGIAGFGGRVHDMLKHFGILEGVFFTNLYVNTISGQYGSRNTPVLVNGEKISYTNVIENRQWLMTHEGPYGKWRNRFLSWVIRNNLKSLKMVMLLGQAGKDAGSNLVNYLGGEVGAYSRAKDGSQYNVPWFEMVGAGGNNEWAVPMTKDGEDIAELLRQNDEIRQALTKKLENEIASNSETVRALKQFLVAMKSDPDFSKGEAVEQLLAADAYAFSAVVNMIKSNVRDKKSLKSLKGLMKVLGALSGNSLLVSKSKSQIKSLPKANKILKLRILALESSLNYKDGTKEYGISTDNAKDLLMDNVAAAKQLMIFSNGGPKGNGVLYPQQFGGWDLGSMKVNGKKTRSIKGLKVPCGESKAGPCVGRSYVTAPDIVFVGAPHPTSLSMGEMSNRGSAAKKVEKELLKPLRAEYKRGWIPPQPEAGLESPFLKNEPYKYDRGIIPPSHGDPGITDLRLLPVSTASRDGKSMIVIGTRGRATFSKSAIKAMEKDRPADRSLPKSHYVLTGRPQFEETLFTYDRGPDHNFSSLLFKSLEKNKIFWVKDEFDSQAQDIFLMVDNAKSGQHLSLLEQFDERARKIIEKVIKKAKYEDFTEDDVYENVGRIMYSINGIAAFNSKSHPDAGFFGHYRGSFENPRVIILADPIGYDSFITSKAATGERGQYLHGLMRDLGVGNDYLVLKTVPFGMDGATDKEWQKVLERTQDYRDALFAELLDSKKPLLIADGDYAAQELKRLVGSKKFTKIEQSADDAQYGIVAAGKKLSKKRVFRSVSSDDITGDRADIPREHLTWIARVWEGTSGDRVITASDKANSGMAFAIVAPDWARKNKVHFTESSRKDLVSMLTRLATAGEPFPGESLTSFVKRRSNCVSLSEYKISQEKKKCELTKAPSFPSAAAQ